MKGKSKSKKKVKNVKKNENGSSLLCGCCCICMFVKIMLGFDGVKFRIQNCSYLEICIFMFICLCVQMLSGELVIVFLID